MDDVKHPSHYTIGKIEVIDFIQDQKFGYLAGNVVKYICRYRHKGAPVKDLMKARQYLDWLIEAEQNEEQAKCSNGVGGLEPCLPF